MHGLLAAFITILISFSIGQSKASTPAFPGAEGFGAASIGGRGGKVLFVTNLNDSGPGSLRAAVDSDGPRTVIFRVSGTIALKSNLSVKKPYITIAGQTAPGHGICLKDHAFSVSAEHVIIRYIRCRPGDNAKSESDALSLSSGQNIAWTSSSSKNLSVSEFIISPFRAYAMPIGLEYCLKWGKKVLNRHIMNLI